MTAIYLNDQPYKNGEEDPHKALEDTLAFAVDDWAASRAMAWVYGIVCGWDDEDDPDDGAMAELAATYDWDDATVSRLRRLHERFIGEVAG